MPPACALLGMAKAPPSGNQLSHLLDLPIEIRYMIYERLRDRTVPVAIHDLEVPDCVSVRATLVLNCFYPAMLRINEQIADEYTFIVMSRVSLYIRWTIYDADIARKEIQTDQTQPPVLPERFLAQLMVLHLRMSSNTSVPHCNLQAAVRALTGRVPKLRLFLFNSEYDIDRDVSWRGLADSTESGRHSVWRHGMIEFLQKLVDAGSFWIGKMMFYITCSLYLLGEESLYGIPVDSLEYRCSPNVAFAICGGPNEDTFQLDGLHLKFMGMGKIQIERRAAEDCNIVVTITAHEDV